MGPGTAAAAVTAPLADASLFIAIEHGRALRAPPPPRYHVSVVTVGELRLGVLSAPDPETSATRQAPHADHSTQS